MFPIVFLKLQIFHFPHISWTFRIFAWKSLELPYFRQTARIAISTMDYCCFWRSKSWKSHFLVNSTLLQENHTFHVLVKKCIFRVLSSTNPNLAKWTPRTRPKRCATATFPAWGAKSAVCNNFHKIIGFGDFTKCSGNVKMRNTQKYNPLAHSVFRV